MKNKQENTAMEDITAPSYLLIDNSCSVY